MVARKKSSKKIFVVEVKRTLIEAVSLNVEAADADEAEELAFKRIEAGVDPDEWDLQEDESEVQDIYELR